jgi:hypothetical protein
VRDSFQWWTNAALGTYFLSRSGLDDSSLPTSSLAPGFPPLLLNPGCCAALPCPARAVCFCSRPQSDWLHLPTCWVGLQITRAAWEMDSGVGQQGCWPRDWSHQRSWPLQNRLQILEQDVWSLKIFFLFPFRLYRSTYISGPPVWVPTPPPHLPPFLKQRTFLCTFWVHPHPLLGPPSACPKVTVQWSLRYFMDEILQVKIVKLI